MELFQVWYHPDGYLLLSYREMVEFIAANGRPMNVVRVTISHASVA